MAAGIDDLMLLSGMMNAGASTANNLFSTGFNFINSQMQRDWSEQMVNQQNAWNEEMWNKQNDYNSPANQVQRLQAAGLNPLFYGLDGNGNAESLTSAQPLGYTAATAPALVNPIASGQSAMAQMAQIENIQADTAKKNNENLTETQRRENMLAELGEIQAQIALKQAQKNLSESQKESVDIANKWADTLNEAILNEKQANSALSASQKERIDKLLNGELKIQAKTIEDFDKQWKKIDEEIKKISKETGVLEKDLVWYTLNHWNGGWQGTGLSLQNLLRIAVEGNDNLAGGKDSSTKLYSDQYADAVYNVVTNK